MKKVSVVMPVYNMEDRIVISIEALLNQTYSNIEIILVDDGSSDNSYQVCLDFARLHSQVKVFHTENKGAGPARNVGIAIASGDYIYFPDADDFLDEEALQKLVQTMITETCDLIVFGFQQVSHDGKVQVVREYKKRSVSGEMVRSHYEEYLSFRQPFWIQGAPWNKFFDLSIIKNNNVIFPDMRRHQDEVFISRYMTYAEQIQFIPNILYTYYANDVKKEWDKYPLDYLDIAMELKRQREKIILAWNPYNIQVKDIINREYIFNTVKGLELSFSKKANFNSQQRKKWLKDMIEKTGLIELDIPSTSHMKYQALVMKLVKEKRWRQVYYLLFTKVFLQKNMYTLFRKLKAWQA